LNRPGLKFEFDFVGRFVEYHRKLIRLPSRLLREKHLKPEQRLSLRRKASEALSYGDGIGMHGDKSAEIASQAFVLKEHLLGRSAFSHPDARPVQGVRESRVLPSLPAEPKSVTSGHLDRRG
jgi:hypothetical protein